MERCLYFWYNVWEPGRRKDWSRSTLDDKKIIDFDEKNSIIQSDNTTRPHACCVIIYMFVAKWS